MVGSKWVSGLGRAFASGALACVFGASACYGGPDISAPSAAGGGQSQGSAGFDSPPSAGGAVPIAPAVPPGCVLPPSADPVFKAQAYDDSRPARRELYSWVTDEQAAQLRTGRVLFNTDEPEGLGPGSAFSYLSQLATSSSDPEQRQLAGVLGGDRFAKKRYAWSEPWATRMSWPGQESGGNLLRIVLKPEAWLVVFNNGVLSVWDLQNQPVAFSDALLHPERLGAVFYLRDAYSGGPSCNNSDVESSDGYREFILGNLAMVEEWSLGTQLIRDRLTSNIADLTRFFTLLRACPSSPSAFEWNLQVICDWSAGVNGITDETFNYEQALAIPSVNYLPSIQQVATIIETLQGDLFEPDPFVVKPGSP